MCKKIFCAANVGKKARKRDDISSWKMVGLALNRNAVRLPLTFLPLENSVLIFGAAVSLFFSF